MDFRRVDGRSSARWSIWARRLGGGGQSQEECCRSQESLRHRPNKAELASGRTPFFGRRLVLLRSCRHDLIDFLIEYELHICSERENLPQLGMGGGESPVRR